MNSYLQMKERHSHEFEEFPIFFAFDNKQFADGMKSLGLDPAETDKIYTLPGTGGFYRKSDAQWLRDIFDQHDKEFQEAIDADPTGEGFVFDMFSYELSNHEFGITGTVSDTLDALGLTEEEVRANPKLKHGLALALEEQKEGASVNW